MARNTPNRLLDIPTNTKVYFYRTYKNRHHSKHTGKIIRKTDTCYIVEADDKKKFPNQLIIRPGFAERKNEV